MKTKYLAIFYIIFMAKALFGLEDNFGVSEEDLGGFNELTNEEFSEIEVENSVENFSDDTKNSNNVVNTTNVEIVPIENFSGNEQINFGNESGLDPLPPMIDEESSKAMTSVDDGKLDLSNPSLTSEEPQMSPVASESDINQANATSDTVLDSPTNLSVTDNGNEFIEQVGNTAVDSGVEAIRQDQLADIPIANDFSGVPAVPGTRRVMARGEAPESYYAEAGDTLYDICNQLLDEPGYWPKLWALNPEIKNPHFIYPGMKISFYPGDDKTPPYMQVVEELSVTPVEKENLTEKELEPIDPSGLFIDNVARETFELVDASTVVTGVASEDYQEIGSAGSNVDSLKVQIPLFVTQEKVEALGTILSGWSGEAFVSEGNELFIEPVSEMAPKVYSVLRYAGEVDVAGVEFSGHKYSYVGSLEVDNFKNEDGLIRARARGSRLIMTRGDLVVPFVATSAQVPLQVSGSPSDLNDAVVVGLDMGNQTIAIQGAFAVINKSVSVGSYVNLYSNNGVRNMIDPIKNLPVDSKRTAKLYIIYTNGYTSTGYITQSQNFVRVGDGASPKKG